MRRVILTWMALSVLLAQTKPEAKPPIISRETVLELKLVDADEKVLMGELQKIVDRLEAPLQQRRYDIAAKECAKYKADPVNGDCSLDLKQGVVLLKTKQEVK